MLVKLLYLLRSYVSLLVLKKKVLTITRKQNNFYIRYQKSRIERDYSLSSSWQHSEKLWKTGQYFQSCKLKEEILTETLQSQNFFINSELPPYLSQKWASNIGHLGSLGVLLKFQEQLCGETKAQTMYLSNPSVFKSFEYLFANKVKTSNSSVLNDIETPTMWSQFQNLEMIRVKERFIPLYAMHEEFFNSEPVTRINSPLYFDSAREEFLNELGIHPSDRFICIHIRAPIRNDMRGVIPGKFTKALNLLIDLGYLILQFGEHPPSIEVANTDRLINISERNDWRQLQVNAMFHSEFLISTNSGPSVLGWAMGVPVLQTDTVALCRNILTASEGSVYLPKSFKKKGTHVPLSELVASGLGYAEYSKSELLKQNIELIDNTEIEIFNAVLEMLDFQNWSKKDYEFSKNQESLGVVGRGKISTDYLAKSDWLKL